MNDTHIRKALAWYFRCFETEIGISLKLLFYPTNSKSAATCQLIRNNDCLSVLADYTQLNKNVKHSQCSLQFPLFFFSLKNTHFVSDAKMLSHKLASVC